MAVKLRLMRMGKKKQPTYRVVAADSRSPRNGRFIEIVGIYDPRPDPSAIRIDNDKAVDWLRKGAQPTDSVRKLLEISGAWETFSGQASTRPAPAPKPAAKAGKPEAAAKAVKATDDEPKVEPAKAASKAGKPEAAEKAVKATGGEPKASAAKAAAKADASAEDAAAADAAEASE
ncbi:MAG TPA: 30S ribosomal protein S16 [Acidimicrobiales bacterium]